MSASVKNISKKTIWWHGRLALSLLFVTVLILSVVRSVSPVSAEQYEFIGSRVRLVSLESTSAPADGKTPIRFTIEFFGYKCSLPDHRGVYLIYMLPESCDDADGENYGPSVGEVIRTSAAPAWAGNAHVTGTINAAVGFSNRLTGGVSAGHPHHQTIYPGEDGRVTLSLVSVVPESKHVHVDNGYIIDPNNIEFDVTFTPVPGAKPTPSPAAAANLPPPSSAVGAVDTTKFTPEQLASPTVTPDPKKLMNTETVSVNDVPVSQSDEKQEFQPDEGIVVSGTAVPNAKVTLYVFSEPQVIDLVADANGFWSHTITGLPPGDHHIESEVLDPATNTKSGRINLTAFRIAGTAAPGQSAIVTIDEKPSPYLLAAVSLLSAVIGAGVIILIRHRKLARLRLRASSPAAKKPLRSKKK